jgi:alkylation response protein AidB-like acyl-CoA dehydrogenase
VGGSHSLLDRAGQVDAAGGLTDDLPLAQMHGWARVLRLADGPDEVHEMALARRDWDVDRCAL